MRRFIQQYLARTMGMAGDAVLAEFPNVVNAMQCILGTPTGAKGKESFGS